MLGMLLFGAALAVLFLFLVNLSVNKYVGEIYLSEEKRIERDRAYKADLQEYAISNRLSSKDTDKIAEWAQKHRYLYVMCTKNDELLFESGSYNENEPGAGEGNANTEQGTTENGGDGAGITVKPPNREELIENAIKQGSYPIYMSDGVILVSMVDYTEYIYYDVANIASFIVAIVTFFIVMWCYFYSITKRIEKLGKEVTRVAEGDVRHPIAISGEDEITRLSMDVEYMRSAMLENLEKEHAALESNKELITAMSHDIRTPLTVLLGYLDVMKINAPEGTMAQYLEASENTALRLKKMSDDMFSYFLAYGGTVGVEVQECNARTLIEQMLSGHIFLLREQGYKINYNFENEDHAFLNSVVLVTDPPQLMRIIENIFSNVMKYADKEQEITVFVDAEIDEMVIKVSNIVSKYIDVAQQSGVGLRSCMKIAGALDIRFSSGEEDGVFTSLMYVPIVPEILYGEFESEDEERGFTAWLKSVLEKARTFLEKLWKSLKELSVKAILKVKGWISALRSKLARKK